MLLPVFAVSVYIADFLGVFGFYIFSFLHMTAGILLFAHAEKVKVLRQAGLCDSVTLTAEEPALGHALGANPVISWQPEAGAQAVFPGLWEYSCLERTKPEVVLLLSLSLELVYLLLLWLTSLSLCFQWLGDSGKSLRQCPFLLLGVSQCKVAVD